MTELYDKNGFTEQEFLERYHITDYESPSVAADIAIFTVADTVAENYRKLPEKQLQLLLIQRGEHPFLGQWALPGGFVCKGETIEMAAQRELFEETGVKSVYLEQLHTFSKPDRDPRAWIISCAYVALMNRVKLTLRAGEDAKKAAWFTVQYKLLHEQEELKHPGILKRQKFELTLKNNTIILCAEIEKESIITESEIQSTYHILNHGNLAFDHAQIIAFAMEFLRNKNDVALHLMPNLFTLTQLQQVYEVILDKPLLKAAFRRKIADFVEETDKYAENGGHRPSKLYRRKLERIAL